MQEQEPDADPNIHYPERPVRRYVIAAVGYPALQ